MARDRRNHVKAKTSSHMYIVAGLPRAVHQRALDEVEKKGSGLILKGAPSPDDGALYSSALVEQLIRASGEFAIKRRQASKDAPTPASITLLYVPSPDQEQLLSVFDFAVMAVPLPRLSAWGADGRQLRHRLDVVIEEMAAAIRPSGQARTNLAAVQQRLDRQSDDEALLLPPRNFLTQDGDLTLVMRDYRSSMRLWDDRLPDLGPTALSHEDVPLRIDSQQTRRPFVDARGMAFFIAHPKAYDGEAREVVDSKDVAGTLQVLRSLYRFGGSLARGLHHDAQRSDGSALGGAEFTCSEKGRVSSTSAYANVYPNDRVRAAELKAVK